MGQTFWFLPLEKDLEGHMNTYVFLFVLELRGELSTSRRKRGKKCPHSFSSRQSVISWAAGEINWGGEEMMNDVL